MPFDSGMGSMSQDGITTYIEKRNWVEFNERLVRRGEMYLSLDFLNNWDEELERTNEGQRISLQSKMRP